MDGIFLQQLVNGLTLGSVYGLIAIGYTMVFGIIGMINFAHGEVYMISAYLAAISLALLAYFGIESFPLLMLGPKPLRYLSLFGDLHGSALRGPLYPWPAVVGACAISIR